MDKLKVFIVKTVQLLPKISFVSGMFTIFILWRGDCVTTRRIPNADFTLMFQ